MIAAAVKDLSAAASFFLMAISHYLKIDIDI